MFAGMTLAAIFLTLILGNPLLAYFDNQGLQALVFVLVLLMVLTTVVLHGLKPMTSGKEMVLLIGMSAVFILFFLRLGLAERSHLVEYSVLAIFIFEALSERAIHREGPKPIWLFSFLLAFGIGIVDECLQAVVPNRVFDIEDIVFNGLAVVMALAGSMLLAFIRRRFKEKQSN